MGNINFRVGFCIFLLVFVTGQKLKLVHKPKLDKSNPYFAFPVCKVHKFMSSKDITTMNL